MMNAFRNVAIAAIVIVTAAPLASAADKDAGAVITGAVTPGVYGRVDIANKPLPALVYEQAMFVERPDTGGRVEPLYLHVPPEHAKNWKKYCDKYQACNHPVFFVKSAEYEPGYEPPKPEKAGAGGKRRYRSGW
jgi:hypothetical protein